MNPPFPLLPDEVRVTDSVIPLALPSLRAGKCLLLSAEMPNRDANSLLLSPDGLEDAHATHRATTDLPKGGPRCHVRGVEPSPQHCESPLPLRVLQPYRCTSADARIRRSVKVRRGGSCESCNATVPFERLAVHHILEARIYREHARNPFNMLVLCPTCHSEVTQCERFAASTLLHFYSRLSEGIRGRHLPFLQTSVPDSANLLSAFRLGNSEYWNDVAVEDLTR